MAASGSQTLLSLSTVLFEPSSDGVASTIVVWTPNSGQVSINVSNLHKTDESVELKGNIPMYFSVLPRGLGAVTATVVVGAPVMYWGIITKVVN